jgi:hypothetical protein
MQRVISDAVVVSSNEVVLDVTTIDYDEVAPSSFVGLLVSIMAAIACAACCWKFSRRKAQPPKTLPIEIDHTKSRDTWFPTMTSKRATTDEYRRKHKLLKVESELELSKREHDTERSRCKPEHAMELLRRKYEHAEKLSKCKHELSGKLSDAKLELSNAKQLLAEFEHRQRLDNAEKRRLVAENQWLKDENARLKDAFMPSRDE